MDLDELARRRHHWVYEVLRGKWLCWETGEYRARPRLGDYYSDAGEWRIW